MLVELKVNLKLPIRITRDHKSKVTMMHDPCQHERMIHMGIDGHYIKEY